MSNPYYPPKSTRHQPGYSNPLSNTHAYPPPFNQTQPDHHARDPYLSSDPYYDPYEPSPNHRSNATSDHATYNPSTENLVPHLHHHPYPPNTFGDPIQHAYPQDQHFELYPPDRPFGRQAYAGVGPYPSPPGSQQPSRPESPFDGVYHDRPPKVEKMNEEQRRIYEQFPKDLDDEGGGRTMIESFRDLLKDWKKAFKLKYLHYWIIMIVICLLVVLMTIYHRQIIDWLTPLSKKITAISWGWVIPVAILFILNPPVSSPAFPPLFGHEIVIILCGVVYGLWVGFGIACLGTLLGEIGNFYAFKYCLRGTAARYERKNIHYACMAEMVREGGFLVIFLARLSAIPGHFTTAVFATVGMNIFIFILAAFLALPKQLSIVYLGVAIRDSDGGTESTASKMVKYAVLVISFIITMWTAWWLYQRMERVRPEVQRKLRARRYTLLTDARGTDANHHQGHKLSVRRFENPSSSSSSSSPQDLNEYCAARVDVNVEQDLETGSKYGHYDQGWSNRAETEPSTFSQGGGGGGGWAAAAAAAANLENDQAMLPQLHKSYHHQHQDEPERQHANAYANVHTPPIGSFNKESDLSEARPDTYRSPATDREDKNKNPPARYKYASNVGSIYNLGSETAPAGSGPPKGFAQGGQAGMTHQQDHPRSTTNPFLSNPERLVDPASLSAVEAESYTTPPTTTSRSNSSRQEAHYVPTSRPRRQNSTEPHRSDLGTSPPPNPPSSSPPPPSYVSDEAH
ncbi:hypothetical protein IE53DRAFT_362357 [Violaceomyces palustris]|uniref:Uncharacterized protein n=1 Tax=Violaceomyces palustris TaxID=1673888 RepID=A0ACD0NXG9_9BASI|nr:hypothetical protein IE53DRAFT_362357 [Violaceomyces palustris]